jgi:isochorismate synthase
VNAGGARIRPNLASDLTGAVASATRRASHSGRPQWVSGSLGVAACDGLALFARSDAAERFFWERPSEASQIAALGAARAIETRGPSRFADAARAARELAGDVHLVAGQEGTDAQPFLVGGFAFGDERPQAPEWAAFPPGRLVLPELLVTRRGGGSRCSVTRRIEPGAEAQRESALLREQLETARRALAGAQLPAQRPASHALEFRAAAHAPPAFYRASVEQALRAIAAGDLEKVVLARAVRLASAGGFPVESILDTLRRVHPSCASFAVARPGATFLGAAPERLLRLEGRRVETAALAGSARRGRSPEEDARLGRQLCESKKEQAEHEVVVRALREALGETCDEIAVPEAPQLLRLEGIQHLETPLVGTLRGEASVLELAGSLHPTPAVAGEPQLAALAWIAQREEFERGWYAGAIGVVRHDDGGEFCVALRSALLRGETAHLFAGAGIVAGSDPDAELRETRLKLRAMLGALVEL